MPDNAKSYLFIINDAPYGNERPYNALRLALDLVKRPEAQVHVFLIGDGVNSRSPARRRRRAITTSSAC